MYVRTYIHKMQGFDHHVKEEHCMWNYIYYYSHLEKIDINDHNAIDSYVYQLVMISQHC